MFRTRFASSDHPLISIIMPTYNRAQYIRQAIESICAQDYPHWELIIMDDGSTDKTSIVIADLLSPRVRYLSQPQHGPAAARNAALQHTTGEFIAFLDSDDVYLPGKLSAQIAVFRSQPAWGAVHSGWQSMDDTGVLGPAAQPWTQAPRLDLESWLKWKPVFLGGIIVRAEWIRKAGPFNEKLFQTDDVDLMFRLSAAGCRMTWWRQATVGYRIHASNITRDSVRQAQDLWDAVDGFLRQVDDIQKVRALAPEIRFYTLLWIAFTLWRDGKMDLMKEYLARSVELTPFTGEQILLAWHASLVHHLLVTGGSLDQVPLLELALIDIPVSESVQPERTKKQMQWLSRIWWPYQQSQFVPRETLHALSTGLTSRELAKALQVTLLIAPAETDGPAVERLWTDMVTSGIVRHQDEANIITAQLTLFSQAVFRRKPRMAIGSLGAAIGHTGSSGSLAAWGRFLGAAYRYGSARITGQSFPSARTRIDSL
jgi:glycosyltransferase involved in cell wall biosynthesis